MKNWIKSVSICVFFLTSTVLWADDSGGSLAERSKKVFIIPIEQSTRNPNPRSFDKVIFRSLFTFMSIIPSLDVPDTDQLEKFFWMSPILFRWDRVSTESAPQQILSADYIVYGDYELNKADKTKVGVTLAIWSKESNKTIFTQKYNTTTDIDVFDTIDQMLADIVRGVLHVDFSLARIRFELNCGKGTYDIFINNRKVDTYKDDSYNRSLSVLGKQTYHVMVRRKEDGRIVADKTALLKQGETLDITYIANGDAIIQPVAFAPYGTQYTYIFDGKPINPGSRITNLQALKPHSLVVSNDSQELICFTNFQIADQATVSITPEDRFPGAFHMKAFVLGSTFGGLSAEYFLTRYLYLSAGVGFSAYTSQVMQKTLFNIPIFVESGYYIYGDLSREWRAGVGAQTSITLYLPPDSFEALDPDALTGKNNRNYSFSAGGFIFGEWNFITLKTALLLDIGNGSVFFSPSVGVRF